MADHTTSTERSQPEADISSLFSASRAPSPAQLIPSSNKSLYRNTVHNLKNQQSAACRPILSETFVFPVFLLAGLIFIPVGAILIATAEDLGDVSVDYTNCKHKQTGQSCAEFVEDIDNQVQGLQCPCEVDFDVWNHLEKDVTLYYKLTNFYQNHRRFVESRDDAQLMGTNLKGPHEDCDPFHSAFDPNVNETLPVAPCGAIANAMFNDTFQLECVVSETESIWVPLLRTGIAYPIDKQHKFRNPSGDGSLRSRFEGTTKPPNWHKYIYELDTENPDNNGFSNEDFIVWMRTSMSSTVRKPHRRIDHTHQSFVNGLPEGRYVLHVNYSYPVTGFGGTKEIVLSRSTLTGGYDLYIGIMYCIMGGLALCMCVVLVIVHVKYSVVKRKKPQPQGNEPDLGASFGHLATREQTPENN